MTELNTVKKAQAYKPKVWDLVKFDVGDKEVRALVVALTKPDSSFIVLVQSSEHKELPRGETTSVYPEEVTFIKHVKNV